MLRKALFLAALVALIVGATVTAVSAQDGGGDKFVLGENFVLHSDEVLNGNLAVLGGNATLERGSTVRGDAAVAGGQLIVAGTIEGSTAVLGGSAALEDTAVINGDLASFGGSIQRAPGAVVRGETLNGWRFGRVPFWIPLVPRTPEIPTPLPSPSPFGGFGSLISWQFATIGWSLMMVLLGIIAILVAPKHMGRITNAAAGQPVVCFGAGLLTFVVGILAGGLLLIACCLGLFVWLALAIAVAVGWIAVGLWFGQRLLKALKVHDASSLVEVALGVFLITFIGRLPLCIGFLFSALVGSIGLGAVVLTRFGRQPTEGTRDEPAGPPPQFLEDLDAEVLAPLGLPSVGTMESDSGPTLPLGPVESPPVEPGEQPTVEPTESPSVEIDPPREP